jgi:hypothetical protein
MEETERVVLNGWVIWRIFPTGVTVYAFGRSRFIAKSSPEWRRFFGNTDQLPLTPEQRVLAARLGLFHGVDGRPIKKPAETESAPSAPIAPDAA